MCLSISAGDKVVTLAVCPVMGGPKQLGEVQAGTEFIAEDLKGSWV